MTPSRGEYSEAIYVAKGIAIILIVIGHFQPVEAPPLWYQFREIIYTFHIQVFMFLSGFLFAGDKAIANFSQYIDFLKKKARRLLLPFFSIATIILILKLLSGVEYQLVYPITYESILNLFLNPVESFASTLWFLYVLFEIFIICGAIYLLTDREYLLIAFSMVCFCLPWIFIFMIGPLFYYLPVFVVGIMCFKHNFFEDQPVVIGVAALLLFVVLLLLKDVVPAVDLAQRTYRLGLGVFGAMACFGLSIRMARRATPGSRCLKFIGSYALVIYLIHPPVMGMVRFIALAALPAAARSFLVLSVIVVTYGVFVPIVLEKYILRRYKLAGALILGNQWPGRSAPIPG